MFRFFCSECKSVRRVQKIPTIIENQNTNIPANRIGICDFHSRPKVIKTIKSNRITPEEPISINRMNKKRR